MQIKKLISLTSIFIKFSNHIEHDHSRKRLEKVKLYFWFVQW